MAALLGQLVVMMLETLATMLLHPVFWLVVLLVGLQNRRLARVRVKLTGAARQQPVWGQTLQATLQGVLGGLVGSLLMVMIGVSLSQIGIGFLWVLAVILMLVHPRLLCFSYAGGLLSLSYLLLGFPQVEVPALIGLVAILHMVESVLIMLSGHMGAIPVYARHVSGRVVGAFNLQRFWPIPVVALLVVGVVADPAAQGLLAMPEWWPLLRPPVALDPDHTLFALIPVAAGLGYGDLALSASPVAKSRRAAWNLGIYSLLLLGLAVAASRMQGLEIVAALAAPLGHEFLIRASWKAEINGKPLFVNVAHGLAVLDTVRGTPADRLGLRTGDILLRVNKEPVYSRYDLAYALQAEETGVMVEYQRQEQLATVSVYRKPGEAFGLIPVPQEGDLPQVDLKRAGSGLLLRWWSKLRGR